MIGTLNTEFRVNFAKHGLAALLFGRGVDKNRAVMQLMHAPPYVARRPLFVGDDYTGEYGFAAVEKMGGHAPRIGALPDRGRQLASSAHVRVWLARQASSLGAQVS